VGLAADFVDPFFFHQRVPPFTVEEAVVPLGRTAHSLALPCPSSDFTRMQDIPEETESRDGESVASES
jgi:hypothetical protein